MSRVTINDAGAIATKRWRTGAEIADCLMRVLPNKAGRAVECRLLNDDGQSIIQINGQYGLIEFGFQQIPRYGADCIGWEITGELEGRVITNHSGVVVGAYHCQSRVPVFKATGGTLISKAQTWLTTNIPVLGDSDRFTYSPCKRAV